MIKKPTLVIDEDKARKNLAFMAEKIKRQNVNFRPHFKTHQSDEIGEMFREYQINTITVSSVDMAVYFAAHGWEDIFIAFPVNILQIEEILELSNRVKLSLLFEEPESVVFIDRHLSSPVSGWIKIDSGAHRAGLMVNQLEEIYRLAKQINESRWIKFIGIATHAGHSYAAVDENGISAVYRQSLADLQMIKKFLLSNGLENCLISVGDTPSARLVDDFGEVDELRPGNFLFYDVQQYKAGVCEVGEIAVALACPIVAVHRDRKEAVLHAGAVHLSKDTHKWETPSGYAYGLVCLNNKSSIGWDDSKIVGFIRSLSQEHGIAVFPEGITEDVKTGEIIYVLPAHSCLTVQAMRQYTNMDGEIIKTMLD